MNNPLKNKFIFSLLHLQPSITAQKIWFLSRIFSVCINRSTRSCRLDCKILIRSFTGKLYLSCSVKYKLPHNSCSFPMLNVSRIMQSWDMLTFTKEILNGKLIFLCNELDMHSFQNRTE